ncbi:hypothetical protein N7491_000202 [Penicillium cf. griseofulvum]|nr:hypothetical protein N7491_000202 [Penicillium cf. griseofulvum]
MAIKKFSITLSLVACLHTIGTSTNPANQGVQKRQIGRTSKVGYASSRIYRDNAIEILNGLQLAFHSATVSPERRSYDSIKHDAECIGQNLEWTSS